VLVSLLCEVNRYNEKSHLSTNSARTGIQVAAPATPFQRRQQTALALVAQQMGQVTIRLETYQ
jgi:hypothetical protein